MNNEFVVVSFYTGEGQYKEFATQLASSCEENNIKYEIEELKSQKHWVKNNAMKPNFILKKLLKYRKKVIWLDADCQIISYPKLFLEPFDFSIYRWYFDSKGKETEQETDQCLFSGGVIGFNYSVKALELLIRWTAACNANTLIRDDNVLDGIYSEFKNELKLNSLWLPKSYNRMGKHWPDVQPIIEHHWGDGRIFTGEQLLVKG